MKAEAKTTKPKFEPVTLTVTFETKEELEAFHAMLSHSRIVEPLNFSDQALEMINAIVYCVEHIRDAEAFSRLDKALREYKD